MCVVVGTCCIFPIDMVKTRLQANDKGRYSGPVDVVKKIISQEGGIRALYRGLPVNLIGVTPEKAIKLVRISSINMILLLSMLLPRKVCEDIIISSCTPILPVCLR
ncbi:solute carrier family 25 protein [archaeon]|nr:MAG: solute carrier family 25 protein [archaeon]